MEYEGHKLRHELKYYINESTYYTLKERFKYILEKDENTTNEDGYVISSLYFDDIFNSALEDKINGTRFRKKYRIRIYNHSDALIKLECKIKYDTFISKVSASLSRQEYDSILNGDYDFLIQRKESICRELYAFNKARILKPVTVVEYKREAYVGKYGNVRLTFDKNIASSIISLDMFSQDFVTTEILPEGVLVLEVKYDDFIPKYILGIIQSSMTQKCAISKYVMCRNRNRRVRLI